MSKKCEVCERTGKDAKRCEFQYEWQHVGIVSVDGTMIRIGDPSYTIEKVETWKDICDFLDAEKFYAKKFVCENDANGIPGKSIFVQYGYGDGLCPVFIRKNENGRVASILIELEEKGEA